MRGVVLAGGLGTRLAPLTKVTNKHLLPIYDKPMVYYPIETLVRAGVKDIILVTGDNNAGDFVRLLGNGKEFGLTHIDYVYQDGNGGIAEALGMARYYGGGEPVVVILGDNILEEDITPYVESFRSQKAGAKILLKEVDDPERFGVAEIEGARVVGIEEKPKRPKSRFAVTGVYFYDTWVWDVITTLKPSAPGRARDHGREQRLHPQGRDDVRRAQRLVDGRGDLREPLPREQPRRREEAWNPKLERCAAAPSRTGPYKQGAGGQGGSSPCRPRPCRGGLRGKPMPLYRHL